MGIESSNFQNNTANTKSVGNRHQAFFVEKI